jgi:hypothetical protein
MQAFARRCLCIILLRYKICRVLMYFVKRKLHQRSCTLNSEKFIELGGSQIDVVYLS